MKKQLATLLLLVGAMTIQAQQPVESQWLDIDYVGDNIEGHTLHRRPGLIDGMITQFPQTADQ